MPALHMYVLTDYVNDQWANINDHFWWCKQKIAVAMAATATIAPTPLYLIITEEQLFQILHLQKYWQHLYSTMLFNM